MTEIYKFCVQRTSQENNIHLKSCVHSQIKFNYILHIIHCVHPYATTINVHILHHKENM